MKFLLGKKLGMTTLFDETKGALNVTLIVCEENKVTLNRTLEKDGYLAVQLETNKTAKKTVRKELRIDQGAVKRYGFSGGRKSHGGKHDLRKPGSIGATFPEHVVKGRRMAGLMGGANMTARNLTVAYVNKEEGLIGVRGAVPGVNGRIVKIMSVKK